MTSSTIRSKAKFLSDALASAASAAVGDVIAVLGQVALQQPAQAGVVVDHQDVARRAIRAAAVVISLIAALTSPGAVALPAGVLVDQAEQHLVVAGDRFGAGGAVGARELPAQPRR